ncbi:hypothetical protein BD770DRAFT_395365 [Pilaira anomala]|nr:hypothetical protein BD770DRAFT_395365 [Pilaira anomala]
MATKLKLPSIPVRTPKNRFQSEHDEANKIGQRVTIPSLDNCTGILRYVGEPDFKAGVWAGIELDKQGEGKNDGSVQGKRYFVCAPNTGIFIGINKIIIHPPTVTTKKKPSPTSSSTRRSNLPLNRSPSNTTRILNTSSSSSTTTNTKKKTGLRISSVPSASSSMTSNHSSTTTTRATTTPTSTTTTTPTLTTRSTITPPPMTRKKSTPSPATVAPMTPVVTAAATAAATAASSVAPVTPPPPPPSQSPAPSVQEKISQETNQLYEMLEKVQRERDAFQQQMKHKETAWERLVTSKESLALQVEEKEYANRHLQRTLDEQNERIEQLELDLAERDAAIAKTYRDDEKTSQDQRRIERLENLVRELQAQIKTSQETQVQKEREYQGSIDQMRREVSSSESMTASLEKECEELRRAGLETMRAYEDSVLQLNAKHEQEIQQKDQHIAHLDYTIKDLKHKQYMLFDDDEKDIETRLKELSNTVQPNVQDQRHRLEEQLELTMTELDSERKTIQSMSIEIDQLKLKVNTYQQQTLSIEQKFESLQSELEKELLDKKRLIEEADNAFEQQAKAEDEHYQLKLSTITLEKEYNEILETNKQLEADYIKLMDEMMVLEKQDASSPNTTANTNTHNNNASNSSIMTDKQYIELKERIKLLEKEKDEKTIQVKQLHKDLTELESLVENRVFGEAELEEKLEEEKKKVLKLSRELNELKSNYISPTTSSTTEDLTKYCDLCKKYGHDLTRCKNTTMTLGKMYCDNCDDYGNHITEDCPNQDETF